MQSTEKWLPVVGYEGAYEVSDHGRVRSLDRQVSAGNSPYWIKGLVRRTHVLPNGYEHIVLKMLGKKKNQYVHRLVAIAFCDGYEDGLEVMHADGNRLNNWASNLSWGTRSANIDDQVRHGTHANAIKTHCPQGHGYTPENTYSPSANRGWRECRVCIGRRIESRRARTRAERRAATQ